MQCRIEDGEYQEARTITVEGIYTTHLFRSPEFEGPISVEGLDFTKPHPVWLRFRAHPAQPVYRWSEYHEDVSMNRSVSESAGALFISKEFDKLVLLVFASEGKAAKGLAGEGRPLSFRAGLRQGKHLGPGRKVGRFRLV